MYPIKVVSKKTGLSLHVIRAWEKRYNVVEPKRTETNRRLYCEADVHRLSLLKKATDSGFNIGNIAELSISRLEELLNVQPAQVQEKVESESNIKQDDSVDHYNECMDAIRTFDSTRLESALIQASLSLTQPVLIDSVIIPLVEQVGELWREGSLRIMHEHMATAILKTFLSNLRNAYRPSPQAPALIVTTPLGQVHEIGALIISLVAAAEGWRVVYLGTSLPAEEIVAATVKKNARAVVLSIVYPLDDPFLYQELEKLRKLLPAAVEIIIGGRGASNYGDVLKKISALSSNSFSEFRNQLSLIEKNNGSSRDESYTL